MCGCWRCGEPTYGLIKHSEENCINALKGALRAAREGREMVRATGETYRSALVEIKRVAAIEAPPVSDEVPAKVWKIAYEALG